MMTWLKRKLSPEKEADSTNWQELYDITNINTSFTFFSNYMTNTFHKCFPKETTKKKSQK